jgi:hypothetical protein
MFNIVIYMEYPTGEAFCSLPVHIYPISTVARKGGIKALLLLRTAYITSLGAFTELLTVKGPSYKAFVFYQLTR